MFLLEASCCDLSTHYLLLFIFILIAICFLFEWGRDTTTLSLEMHTVNIHTGNLLSILDFDNQNLVVLDQVLDVI
jgi:hypothetical protein